MKSTFVLFVPLVLFLIGCSRAPAPDPRLDQLETRIAAVETNLAASNVRIEQVHSLVMQEVAASQSLADFIRTNLLPSIVLAPLPVIDTAHATDPMRGADPKNYSQGRIDPATGLPARNVAPAQIPASVVAQIRVDAAQRYPSDYATQLYVIKEQTDAWTKLHQ